MIIDAVYTWVDGSDPQWQALRQHTRQQFGLNDDSTEPGFADRYIQHGELQISLQRLKRFAPWIRRVYIVTMNQRPKNLPDGLDIRIVDHKDILPADALPTFNSHAIETALHRIPDLAEHFLYFNDDMFIGKPVQPSDFFDATGKSVIPWQDNKVIQPTIANSYESALMTSALLVAKHFGLAMAAAVCRYPSHTVLPKTKHSLLETWRLCPVEMKATEQARFRIYGQLIHFISNFFDLACQQPRAILVKGDARYFATDQDLYDHWVLHRSVPRLFCVNQVRTTRFVEIMNEVAVSQPVKIRRRKF